MTPTGSMRASGAPPRTTQIGLDRLVHLPWLARTAALVLAGNEPTAIKWLLQEELKSGFRSDNTQVRGSLDKSITILLRVWVRTPPGLTALRDRGLELLRCLPLDEQLAVHWGMLAAVYPFWASVAAQTGRLLELQGAATAAHVQRRVREQYGERETVARRTRYVLRSYVAWGVLVETAEKGIYRAAPRVELASPRLIAWLVEALLAARGHDTAPLQELLASPALFPFRLIQLRAAGLVAASPRLESIRHGLDEEWVAVRE